MQLPIEKRALKSIRSVCLALGPYRNLTTLVGAALALHPNCQVLNHAARIFTPDVDFLTHYSMASFERFIEVAIRSSGGGQRGSFGGSITYSHAFDDAYLAKSIFSKRNYPLIKEDIRSLFWKESHLVTNFIRSKPVHLGPVLKEEPRLRFLMPIRNPLDCARSNLKTGHHMLFQSSKASPGVADIAEGILVLIRWFVGLQKQFPDRFFLFFEHSMTRSMLIDLARFLDVDANDVWLEDASAIMISKSKYQHDAELIGQYHKLVDRFLGDSPAICEQLHKFN
ncbi:MAG TPA: hypothetical protein VFB31_13675 [Pseudolabrys sp.]|nr:hypothetical protein [Pseudolabrys sp.]